MHGNQVKNNQHCAKGSVGYHEMNSRNISDNTILTYVRLNWQHTIKDFAQWIPIETKNSISKTKNKINC